MTPPSSERPTPLHDPDDDLGFALPEPAKPGATRITAMVALAAVLVAGAFLFGYLPRREQSGALANNVKRESDATPTVEVLEPKRIESDRPISLPASLQPLAETILYPRANGYVQRFLVDIGERVKENQLLAQIQTPELDSQLDQARATLLRAEAAVGQAEAQRDYAKSSLNRFEKLQPSGVTSRQELDQRSAEARVSEANVSAALANVEVVRADVRRLTQLKSFARVVAPFEGIIVQRTIERGALVSSGNSTPLFRIAQTDPMRVFVQVPQDVAVTVRAGGSAEIDVRAYPGRKFKGTITRAAGALDPTTRTLLTEIRLPNPKNELLSGMYVLAELSLPGTHTIYELPSTALYSDAKGLRVAVVDAQNRIHFQPIVLERDVGATIQIASGLTGNERVLKLADAALDEGSEVRVRK